MNALNLIREKIQHQQKVNPRIHISFSTSHPKTTLKSITAIIQEIYPNVFRVKECDCPYPKYHTLQYADVLTKRIEILEFSEKTSKS